ncbi:MAG: CatA-like O-acetyltransferase [Pseudoflavonifractor sp.]|nr:CatA-like O-acetyltransferase [Pseudoflavonifractor sp.]
MTVVERENWPRRERYDLFAGMAWPFWSVTIPVEVTALHRWCRERGLSFYYAMVYAVTWAMEEVEAFHYKDREGTIVRHDSLVPSFTDLRPGSEDFYIVTLEAGADMEKFCRRARAVSRAQKEFLPQGPWPEDQLIYFTALPWFPITALSNERDLIPWDSIPRVSGGKYVADERGREMLSLSLELNHRLLDGVHAGRFYEKLIGILEAL